MHTHTHTSKHVWTCSQALAINCHDSPFFSFTSVVATHSRQDGIHSKSSNQINFKYARNSPGNNFTLWMCKERK